MEKIQDLLSVLEIKIRGLTDEKKILIKERDAMVGKILELQEKLDLQEKKIEEMVLQGELKDQDLLMTSMVVEELLEELDDKADFKESSGVLQ